MIRSSQAADAAVGMMDGAYFTSRKEILDFFNNLLDLNLTKIEQTASGAVACQLTEYIFPGSIPMKRVNWEAKSPHEYIPNYKLLQAAFNKHRVQRHVDVDRLIRAKYQDNLEFCQWLKAFYDQAAPPLREDYDPVAVRAKGKGGKKVEQHFNKNARDFGSKPVLGGTGGRAAATPARPVSRQTAGGGGATTKKGIGSGPLRTQQKPQKENTAAARNGANQATDAKKTSSSAPQTGKTESSVVADATLMKKNSELTSKLAELELTLGGIERERDFYFEKLRGIEVMLQVHQEKGAESDADQLISRIFKVLYATSDDRVEVTDDGELVGDISDPDGDDDLINEHIGDGGPSGVEVEAGRESPSELFAMNESDDLDLLED